MKGKNVTVTEGWGEGMVFFLVIYFFLGGGVDGGGTRILKGVYGYTEMRGALLQKHSIILHSRPII